MTEIIPQITYENLIPEHKFLAHLPKTGTQEPETLTAHSNLTIDYFRLLSETHDLKPVISRLIKASVNNSISTNKVVTDLMFHFFTETIYLHDLGKINPAFQCDKMQQTSFSSIGKALGSKHALPGLILFLNIRMETVLTHTGLNADEKITLLIFLLLFGQQILRHHSPELPSTFLYLKDTINFLDDEFKSKFLEASTLFNELMTNNKVSPHWNIINKISPDNKSTFIGNAFQKFRDQLVSKDAFSLFALLKLHYSLLTASDYLATSHYMNNSNAPMDDLGTIDATLKHKIIKSLKNKKSYNKLAYEQLNIFKPSFPQKQSNKNLNHLRQQLSIEVIRHIRKYHDDLVYYIEAPTGGGKTNLSMIALAELLNYTAIKNVFYVFPFTTLITQTYQSLIETLGLSENEIIQLHSKAGFTQKNDDNYGNNKQNYIDYLFVNYPIVLLSHVKFFDILKTNRKEDNYLLHRLANSVVIIDEVQSYNPKDWDKVIYFIDNYARQFNIRFILMSATLPKLGELTHVKNEIRYLIDDKKQYFQNPNFKNRVEFDYSLLEWPIPDKNNKEIYLNGLAEKVLATSINYAANNNLYEGSVFAIIEFIYKQTASLFSQIIETLHQGFFNEIFILSGTILEPRRKEIIHYIKNELNRKNKILLITTQVVEAGVDIDMDLGFKDQSLIDSDEQLAGRINRNVNKPACKLYLFNCDSADILYGTDKRYKLMQRELHPIYKEILETKDFDQLYQSVMAQINHDTSSLFKRGFDEYEKNIQGLDYPAIHRDFKIINQQSESVFVPLSLPIIAHGINESFRNFSEPEINFLVSNGVINKNDVDVCGESVFEFYQRLILEPNADFIDQKIHLKKLQGIMSQFIFSLMMHSNQMKQLLSSSTGEYRYGFFFLSHWETDQSYNYHLGLSAKQEEVLFL